MSSHSSMTHACRIAKEQLLNMHVVYRMYMNTGNKDIPSTGTVANYSGMNSGKTNRTSDFTAMLGIQLANIPAAQETALKWMDCAWAVFMRGITSNATFRELPPQKRQHIATIAFILYHKAFLGKTFTEICQIPMPHGGSVSRQRVQQYWKEAILYVAREAMARGLV